MSSPDVRPMPPWKVALLEKRRRQEEEDRRRREDEESKLDKMPAWKRDILLRKQQQKNSHVFLAKEGLDTPSGDSTLRRNSVDDLDVSISPRSQSSNPDSSGSSDVDSQVVAQTAQKESVTDPMNGTEHLLPVQQNPWLVTDPRHKRFKPPKPNKPAHLSGSRSHSSINSLHNHSNCSETDGLDDSFHEQNDDVFKEDTVQYGRGFVNKLLKKFTDMTARDDIKIVSHSKRSHSADNLLEEARGMKSHTLPRSRSTTDRVHDGAKTQFGFQEYIKEPSSPSKARSMDNISQGGDSESSSVSIAGSGHVVSGRVVSPARLGVLNHVDDKDVFVDDVDGSERVKSSSSMDNILEEELPKPNIVSEVRSIFEVSKQHEAPSTLPRKHGSSYKLEESLSKWDKPAETDVHADRRDQHSRHEGHSNISDTPDASDLHGKHNGVIRGNNADSGVVLNHIHDNNSDRSGVSEESIKNIRAAGRSWYFSEKGSAEVRVNRFHGDSNSNYTISVSNDRANVSSTSVAHDHNEHVSAQHIENSEQDISSSISRNNEINNFINISSGSDTSITPEKIEVDTPDWRWQKQPAPSPPVAENEPEKHSTVNSMDSDSHASPVKAQNNASVRDALKADKRLHLDLSKIEPKSRDVPAAAKSSNLASPSYRELYFNSTQGITTPSSNSVPKETSSESSRDGETAVPAAGSTVNSQLANSGRTQRPTTLEPPADSIRNGSMSTSSQSVKEELEVPREGESVAIIESRKPKRPPPSGRGHLLIRPASNLAPASSIPFLNINKYEDVRTGVFEPVRKRPTYQDVSSGDIPITNIDDVLGDDVPITNIDDLPSPQHSPKKEQDADKQLREVSQRYEFIGSGVIFGKSLLQKSGRKLSITFNPAATTTYEYPSEQSLLEQMPSEPGDFDFIGDASSLQPIDTGDTPVLAGGSNLMTSPAVSAAGGLGSYRSRFQMDYEMGMEGGQLDVPGPPQGRPEPSPPPEDVSVKPADDDNFTWSDATGASDMLF